MLPLLLRGEGKKGWDPGEGKVGNTGFTPWRASDLAVALMDAMDAECAAEVRAAERRVRPVGDVGRRAPAAV